MAAITQDNRDIEGAGSRARSGSREMPHNLRAEQAVLGCLINDSDLLVDILPDLEDRDFYHESHQIIYQAIKGVYNASRNVDFLTVYDKLRKDGNLTKVGDMAYLTEITSMLPSSANVKEYKDIVKRDSISRQLIHAAQDIDKNARETEDATKSIQYAEALVYAISEQGDTSTMHNVADGEVLQQVIDKFQEIEKNGGAIRGVKTGFNEIDRITNGLQKSDLIVIAARPGMGKTTLSMNMVTHAALVEDKVCVVFSLEMPENQIVQRMMCSEAEVSMSNALAGKLTQNDWKLLVKTKEKLMGSNIIIDDSSRVTPAEMLSKCRRIKARYGRLDLVMVDYIQLMSSGKSNEENRVLEIASITRDLKLMAKELDVPVIALSQLKRMDGKPSLTDLRDSGAIEQDADIVMFIYKKEDKTSDDEELARTKNIRYVSIAKHRNGETRDDIELRFRGELTKFVNPELNNEMVARAEDYEQRSSARKPARRREMEPPPEAGGSALPPEDEDPYPDDEPPF